MSRNARFAIWVVVALAAGFAGGLAWRRWRSPTFEEQVQDAAKDLQRQLDQAAERLRR
jgi:Flp pilus assembly protein CpaB